MPARRLDLFVRASRFAEAPLRDGLPVHLHLGTADIVGRVAVLGGRSISPGESGFVQVDFEQPIGALHGDRAVLRDHAARHTLAGGRVVDPFPPRRGRRLPARLAVLEATAEADPARALLRILDVDGLVALPDFALARNLTPAELDSLTGAGTFLRVGPAGAPVALTPDRLAALCDQVVAALTASHRAQPDALGPDAAGPPCSAAGIGARGGARGGTRRARRRRPRRARRCGVAVARASAAADAGR